MISRPHSAQPRRKLISTIESLEARIAPATFHFIGDLSTSNRAWTGQINWFNEDTGQASDGFPNAEGDIAKIDDSQYTPGTGNLVIGQDITVGEIRFSGDVDLNINVANAATLTIDGAGIARGTVTHSGTGDLRIRPQLNTADGVTFNVSNIGELNYEGVLTGADGFGGYTKTGVGSMSLTGGGENTYGARPNNVVGFTVSGGTLALLKTGGAEAISDGSIFVTPGATLIVGTTGGAEQIANNATLIVEGTLVLNVASETIAVLAGSGSIDLDGNTLRTGGAGGGGASTFGGVFTDSGTIDLTGANGVAAGLFTRTSANSTASTLNFIGGRVNVTGNASNYTFVLDGTGLSGTGTLGSVSQKASGAAATISSGPNGVATTTYDQLDVAGAIAGSANPALNVRFDLNGFTPGTNADLLVVSGNGALGANVNANFNVTAAAYVAAPPGTTFTIVDVQNGTAVTPFNGLAEGAQVASLGNGGALAISYAGGDGNDVVLSVVPDLTNVVTLAPTGISPNGRIATFTDTDGDTVTVTVNKGGFTDANFLYRGVTGGTGGLIEAIDLSFANFGLAFQNATLTVKVTKAATGDGFVNIGRVNATGIDLAKVTVPGDLGQIDAGDAVPRTRGLGTLAVHSLGAFAFTTQRTPFTATADYLTSSIVGKLGVLSATVGKSGNTAVFGIANGFVDVSGGDVANAKFGGIGRVVADALQAAPLPTVQALDGTVTFASGTVRAAGPIGTVFIENGISGSTGDYSGDVWSRTSIASVKVGGRIGFGNVVGGAGFDSGAIFAGSPDNSGAAAGRVATVILKGSLIGGAGINSGTIHADSGLGSVTIGGSVTGGPSAASGAVVSGAGIGSVRITGTLSGGAAPFSGSIVAFDGNVGSINVTGAIESNSAAPAFTGVFVHGALGSLKAGALNNNNAAGFGVITALGKVARDGTLLAGAAIGSLIVNGNVNGWAITAGFDEFFDVNGTNVNALKNPDAGIGTVKVGGQFSNSAITAGTLWFDSVAGNGNEVHIGGDATAGTQAAIAAITIRGQTTNAVIEAQRIASVTVAGVRAALTAGVDFPPIAGIPGATIVEIV